MFYRSSSMSQWIGINSLFAPSRFLDMLHLDHGGVASTLLYAYGRGNDPISMSWYSINAGESWNSVPYEWITQQGTSILRISQHNPSRWYHLSDSFIRISSDSGFSWQMVELDGNAWQRTNLIEASYGDSVLFVTSAPYVVNPDASNGDLLVSFTHGRSWTRILDLVRDFEVISFQTSDAVGYPDGRILVAVHASLISGDQLGSGILLTDDFGVNWNTNAAGLPDRFLATRLLQLHDQPNTVLAIGTQRFGIFWSRDRGESWEPLNTGLPHQRTHILDLRQTIDNNILAYTEGSGIYRFDIDTETWFPQSVPFDNMGTSGKISATFGGVFLCEPTNRMWYKQHSSEIWEQVNSPQHPASIVYHNPPCQWHGDTVIALAKSRLQPTDEDSTWFLKSYDNGVTWTEERFEVSEEFFVQNINVFEIAGTRYIICHSGGNLAYTASLNQNWTIIRPEPQGFITRIAADSEGVYYYQLLSNGEPAVGRLTLTTGATESLDYIGDPWSQTARLWTYDGNVYLAADYVWRYDDNIGWVRLGDLPQSAGLQEIAVVPISPPIFVARTFLSNTLLVTSDFGVTWRELSTGPLIHEQEIEIIDIEVDTVSRCVWGTSNIGAAYLSFDNLLQSASLQRDFDKSEDKLQVTVSPNPTNNVVSIKVELPRQMQTQIKLYNVQGQLVAILLDELLSPGRSVLNYSLTKYASGIYFVVVDSGTLIQRTKFCLIK